MNMFMNTFPKFFILFMSDSSPSIQCMFSGLPTAPQFFVPNPTFPSDITNCEEQNGVNNQQSGQYQVIANLPVTGSVLQLEATNVDLTAKVTEELDISCQTL